MSRTEVTYGSEFQQIANKCRYIFRKTRRKVPITELRRSARKPWRHLHPKYAAIIATLLPPIVTNSFAAAAAAVAGLGQQQQPSAPPTSTLPPLTHSAAAANLNLNLNSTAATNLAGLAGIHPLAATHNSIGSSSNNNGSTNNTSSSNKANSDLQVVILDWPEPPQPPPHPYTMEALLN